METILSIIAIVLSVISGGFALYSFVWTARRDRKQATLEAYNRLQAEVFDHLNTFTPAQVREACQDTKSPEYKELSGYLARIEHFCVGLNQGIYDIKTFYALAHGYFEGHQLRSRIQPLLELKNKSSNSKELFYVNIYSVLNWMDKKAIKKAKK